MLPADDLVASAALPGRHVSLAGGWSLWRTFMVRAAGLPVALLAPVRSGLDADVADAAWQDALAAERTALRRAAARDEFREALTWQNRGAAVEGLARWLASPPDRDDKRARQRERLVLSYLQRYCAKNDTIGFFGPVGWGTLDDEADVMVAYRPGPGLLASRCVYLEPWAVAAFIATWLADPAFAAAVPWRLHPRAWISGDRLFGLPGTRARDGGQALTLEEAQALAALRDGAGTAGLPPERLRAAGWAVPALAAPWSAEPHRDVERKLARLPEVPAVAAARADLAWLAASRQAVADAAGHPGRLELALGQLETGFTERTGVASRRHAGKTYGGRTLIYEDARRDLATVAGGRLLAGVAAPLALALEAARWFTVQAGDRHRQALAAADTRLLARHGPGYGLPWLWDEMRAIFQGPDPLGLDEVRAALAAGWAASLEVTADKGRRARRDSAAVGPAVRARFAAQGPGFAGARHHGIDLLVAEGEGEALVVLGELHPGGHPFSMLAAREQSPAPAELEAAFRADLPGHGALPVLPDAYCRAAEDARLAPHWWHVLTDPRCDSWRAPERQLQIGELVVRAGPGGPWVARRNGSALFPAEQLFERWLRLVVGAKFRLAPEAPHWPRVTVDGLVVSRETWRVDPQTVVPALSAKGAEGYRRLRRWGDALGLPERVFVGTPEEVKPFMFDRGSVLGTMLFASFARRASGLVITEMLPDLPQATVPDAAGARYTGELRFVAVDARTYPVPAAAGDAG